MTAAATALLVGLDGPARPAVLTGQLESVGFTVVDAGAAGPRALAAAVTDAPPGPVALVDRRFVGHEHALRLITRDPRFPASAGPGVLAVDAAHRDCLTRALRDGTGGDGGQGLDDLAAALSAQVAVRTVDVAPLVAGVASDAAERDRLCAEVAAVDEEAVRLAGAVKRQDGFFTTYAISPWSRYLARWCARHGLRPNQVTLASLLVALVAAALAATGSRAGYVAAAVLLQASFALDCVDGQLARYTLRFERFGAWLDATFDRAKEYLVYAGLALGAARNGDDVWGLALAAMALQSVKHLVDFAYADAQPRAESTPGGAALLDRFDRVGWAVWARRMVILPIGERWALISLLTALTTPRTVFTVLLTVSGAGAVYMAAGRILRSRRRPALGADAPRVTLTLRTLCDVGALGGLVARAVPRGAPPVPVAGLGVLALAGGLAALGPGGAGWLVAAAAVHVVTSGLAVARPLTGRLDWLVPPVLRVAEYGTVLATAWLLAPEALPAAYGLVAAAVYHHYDTVYRLRGDAATPPRWVVVATGGQEGRVAAVALLALAGQQALRTGLAVIAVGLAAVYVTESVRWWTRAGAAPGTGLDE